MKNKTAFTLAEVLVVISIIAIMATVGVPTYRLSMARAVARNAGNNTRMIHAAQQLHRARSGAYATAADLAAISALYGSFVFTETSGTAYSCNGGAGTCTAVGTGFTWTLNLTNPLNNANPACVGANCP
jgi:prepilin-type N-terminal cleavage/methylation domain-containing protein